MLALNGYYNGREFVSLEKVNISPNQRVIITVLDESISEDALFQSAEINTRLDAIDKLNGLLKDQNSDIIEKFDSIMSSRLNFSNEVNV